MMQRQIFEFSDTGTFGDTGPATFGAIRQMRWNPTGGDTGADLHISVLPRMGDTGDGWLVYSKVNALVTNFAHGLGQRQVDSTGKGDTGLVPIYLAGDRIRPKVVNQAGASAATQGRLYIWVENDG